MAKENNVAAQSVLQTYMLERLLKIISISKYKDNFILKGGMLVSAMLGIDSRTIMDMNTTIKGFPLTKDNITSLMNFPEHFLVKIDRGEGNIDQREFDERMEFQHDFYKEYGEEI